MKTILTNEDVKNIFKNIFTDNSEQISLKEEINDDGTIETDTIDLFDYLNIDFYAWKNRQKKVEGRLIPDYSNYEDWVASLDFSLNKTFALVELTDAEVVASNDLDNGTLTGQITFLIQTDKVKNLDYYILKLRNLYMGRNEKIQNMYGDTISAYILMGILIYYQEPFKSQYGEVVEVTLGFRINYLSEALGYDGLTMQISLDGDDLYNDSGVIINESGEPVSTKYLEAPVLKTTWQSILSGEPLSTATRPDLTGIVNTSITNVSTISFYDFNKTLTNQINAKFFELGCYRKNGILSTRQEVNVPVYIRFVIDTTSYVYKMVISTMEKIITNGDFNITSLSIKTWGKIE